MFVVTKPSAVRNPTVWSVVTLLTDTFTLSPLHRFL